MIPALLLCFSLTATPTCAVQAPVPDVAAPHPLWCLPTAVAAVLQSRGNHQTTPRDLARQVTMYQDGTTLAEIGRELDRRGVPWLAWQGPLERLERVLALGAPLVAVSQNPSQNHAIVLDGAQCCPAPPCSVLRAMDPASGRHSLVAAATWANAAYLLVDPPQRPVVARLLAADRTVRVLAQGRAWPQ